MLSKKRIGGMAEVSAMDSNTVLFVFYQGKPYRWFKREQDAQEFISGRGKDYTLRRCRIVPYGDE